MKIAKSGACVPEEWVRRSLVAVAVLISSCGGVETHRPADPNLASSCVTAAQEIPEVKSWHRRERDAVAAELDDLGSCFTTEKQIGHVHVALKKINHAETDVWVVGTTIDDCAVTRCITKKLSSIDLPDPPATLTSDAAREWQTILSYDPNVEPHLRFGATPNVPLSPESPCVDQARLPKSGRLPAAHIASQVRKAAPQMRACYDEGLARNPELSGRVEVRFTIGDDGAMQSVETISNSMPDCKVIACIGEAFWKVHFDRPTGGPVTVVYPLLLEPVTVGSKK